MTIRDFDKQIFLGGSHKEDETRCFSLCNRTVKAEPLLKCTHEEADDRVLFHVNHAVNVGRFGSVVVASSDTDIFVSAAHHFNKLMYNDLQELWLISGRSESRSVVPINDLVDAMDPDFIEVLPAIHALTGCDTTSKFGTKSKAVIEGMKNGYNLLYTFGRDEINDQMIADAEKFLLSFITNHKVDTFDELQYIVYHEKHLQFDIERFPPTSASVRQHILRAYIQCYIWLHAPFLQDIQLNLLDYGYALDENGNLVPLLTEEVSLPEEFPIPCNCLKCSKQTVCPCRVKKIPCCQYCKCNTNPACRNPFKT